MRSIESMLCSTQCDSVEVNVLFFFIFIFFFFFEASRRFFSLFLLSFILKSRLIIVYEKVLAPINYINKF